MPVDQLAYGDHGVDEAARIIDHALKAGKKIALYADYDVDGTMSLVSWIWFFKAIGFANYVYHIPCRFTEGYGLNMAAVQKLVEQDGAELVITMDTGITANEEAAYCRAKGVDFICTDHHVIQPDKMPDCLIVNPKLHPELEYQNLCGCGITFVLLRKLAEQGHYTLASTWPDLLALAGIATICDMVPLNSGVNHQLAKKGIEALCRSKRPIFTKLLAAAASEDGADETDIGFRLGPRINAVGRLEHASAVVDAFVSEDPDSLIELMGSLNEKRKNIQAQIASSARRQAASYEDDPILFLGSEDWHQGVVGICASRIKDAFWKPTWLFQLAANGMAKGSARSIAGFDVTKAMMTACPDLFSGFGGHSAAAGYSFPIANLDAIRSALTDYAAKVKAESPEVWQSKLSYDCPLPLEACNLDTLAALDELRPYGHQFDRPSFLVGGTIAGVDFYKDKQTGAPKHTALRLRAEGRSGSTEKKLVFFNEVYDDLQIGEPAKAIVTLERNVFRGRVSVSLFGSDLS